MPKPITIKDELNRYLQNRRVHDINLAVLAYLGSNAGIFARALMDTVFCAGRVSIERREDLNPPKQRRKIYRGVEYTVRRCGRHLPEASQEEFFGLVRLLKDGEHVAPEKAGIVRNVLRQYVDDYNGAVRAWQLGYIQL
ncbi:MAG: hypothetical protein KJ955_05025 [Nanoarchaeota archaeon]|nr:hypothetical protein [Nanoarchaeota archaeon]